MDDDELDLGLPKRAWVRVPDDIDCDRWVDILKEHGVARPYEALAAYIGCSASAVQKRVLAQRAR